MNNIFYKIKDIKNKRGAVSFALIDPDKKNDIFLKKHINKINNSDFDFIMIGGSLIIDNNFDKRISIIRSETDKPLILFPGSSLQITNKVDAMLYISLLSGNNPQYLIGEHVQTAGLIYNLKIETIPTGYILVDGGTYSSVAAISKTIPLPNDKFEIIASHALAGQYLGMKMLYLETGSGAKNIVNPKLIKYLNNMLDIPFFIGGGINNREKTKLLIEAGAEYIVIGSAIEKNNNISKLKEINQEIHGKKLNQKN